MSLSKRDNTFRNAKDLGVLNNIRSLRGAVGKRDKLDFLKFSLNGSKSFSLSLNGLKDNADVFLYSQDRKLIGASRNKGKKRESIATDLNEGVYYVRVQSRSRLSRVNYRLRLSTQEIFTPDNPDGTGSGGATNPFLPAATPLDGNFVAMAGDKIILSKPRIPNSGEDIELFLFDGSTRNTIQLTNNAVDDDFLEINDSTVVWASRLDTVGNELFFYNFSTGQTKQITNSATEEPRFTKLIDSKIFWVGPNVGGIRAAPLYVYDTSIVDGKVEQIGNGALSEVKFDGSLISYNTRGTDNQRQGNFFYNSKTNTSTQLSSTNAGRGSETFLDADGGYILWGANPVVDDPEAPSLSGLFLTNITTNQTTPLFGGPVSSRSVYMSGSNVAWSSTSGGNAALYFYNGTTGQTVNLFDNPALNLDTRQTVMGIAGSNIVWSSFVGTDTELRLYKGDTQETIRLTDGDDKNDNFIGMDTSTVLWETEDQIFAYNIAANQPKKLLGTGPVLGVAGGNILWIDQTNRDVNSNSFENNGLFYYNSDRREVIRIIDSVRSQVFAENSIGRLNTNWDGISTYWVDHYVDDALYLHNGATNQTKQLAKDTVPGSGNFSRLLGVVGVDGSNAVWTNGQQPDPFTLPDLFYSNGS